MITTFYATLSVIGLILTTAIIDISQKDARRAAPWGFLWAISYTIYVTIPLYLRHISGYTALADRHPWLSSLILERQSASASCLALGFAIGYSTYAVLMRKLRSPWKRFHILFSRKRDKRYIRDIEDENEPSSHFVLTTGGFVCLGIFLAVLSDSSDRYNSAVTNGIAPKILSLLSVNGFFTACFLFMAGSKIASLIYNYRQSNSMQMRLLWRLYMPLATEIAITAIYALKTGSRSIILMCLLSLAGGYAHRHLKNDGSITSLFWIVAIAGTLAMPASETLRIARSNSDFFRQNPLHAAVLLRSSFTLRVSLNDFAIRNRRDELSDSAYISDSELRAVHCSKDYQTSNLVKQCAERETAESRAATLERTLQHISYVFEDFRIHGSKSLFKNIEANRESAIVLGLNPETISPGEQINLAGDLYSKGGLQFVLLGGIGLGISIGGIRELIAFISDRLFYEARIYLITLPLGLLAGNLSLPVKTQAWLAFFQLPKLIVTCIALGGAANILRRKLKY